MDTKNELKGLRVSIIGAAKSGLAIAKLLSKQKAKVFISDKGDRNKLKGSIDEMEKENIEYEVGNHSDRVLDADFAVISPGVPSNSEAILKILKSGKKVYSEIEVASWFCKSKIIAITGSNGKTTTTALTSDIFKRTTIPSFVAGNIGYPFSDFVSQSSSEGVAVLEVSSFQLDHIDKFKPKVSVITNITPDHIDRYGTFEKYIESKSRIFSNQDENDYLVYNYDDPIVANLAKKSKARLLPFSIKEKLDLGGFIDEEKLIINISNIYVDIININKIRIRGKHNVYNSLAASLCALVLSIDEECIRESLEKFKGVEHRLEFVNEMRGINFYNDSKATNVDSVWYALESFDCPIILIAGGRDKGNDYSSILELIEKKVRATILIGEATNKMEKEFNKYTKILKAGSMNEAVKIAFDNAKEGEVVLLSPACASFDMFNNFEHRGKVFKESVLNLSI